MNWINVKTDIHDMLYGDANTLPQGHWVIFRWFHIGTYSKYWDTESKVSIGGPKWQYTDFPLKTTYDMMDESFRKGDYGKEPSNGIPGDISNDRRLYLLERCYRPKEGDIIIEYENCPITDDETIFIDHAQTNAGTPYRVFNTQNVRVDDNTPQYYLAYTKVDREKR